MTELVVCPRDGGPEVVFDRGDIVDIDYKNPPPPAPGLGHDAGVRVDANIPLGSNASLHISAGDKGPEPHGPDFQIVELHFRDGHVARFEASKVFERKRQGPPPHVDVPGPMDPHPVMDKPDMKHDDHGHMAEPPKDAPKPKLDPKKDKPKDAPKAKPAPDPKKNPPAPDDGHPEDDPHDIPTPH